MNLIIIALLLLSIASQSVEPIAPVLTIDTPIPGTEISNQVLVVFAVSNYTVADPIGLQLVVQGLTQEEIVEVPYEDCFYNPETLGLSCATAWNPDSFENGEATITASINSEIGILSDSVTVLVSGHNV